MTNPTRRLLESNTSPQCRRRGRPPVPMPAGGCGAAPSPTVLGALGAGWHHRPSAPALTAHRSPPPAPPAARALTPWCLPTFRSLFCPHELQAPLAPAHLSLTGSQTSPFYSALGSCVLRNPSPWPSASCRLYDLAASRAPSSRGPLPL